MPATDYFSKTYQRLTTTLAADKSSGASSMSLSSATNFPTTSGIKVCVYTLTDDGDIDTDTFCVYRGTVSASQVNNLTLVEGTDQLHTAGATVSLLFTATHWNDAMDGILAHADQDGTLKAGAVDVAAVLADNVVETAKINDSAVTTAKINDSAVTTAKVADGFVVQTVVQTYSASSTGTTILPFDDTVPQNTEGVEFMTLSITPKSATNILVVEVSSFASHSIAGNIIAALFRDSTADAVAASATYQSTATGGVALPLTYKVVAGSTSATTFRVRLGGPSAGTISFNAAAGGRRFGDIAKSSIKITEYKAS